MASPSFVAGFVRLALSVSPVVAKSFVASPVSMFSMEREAAVSSPRVVLPDATW